MRFLTAFLAALLLCTSGIAHAAPIIDMGNGIYLFRDGVQGPIFDKGGGGLQNVKAYGAIGDDTHDDTAAIQAAIAVGPVFLPCGTYKITSPIVFSLNEQAMYGLGYCSVINQHTAAANGVMGVHGDSTFVLTLENFRIDCDTGTCGIGLDMTDVADSHFENIRITVDSGGGYIEGARFASTAGFAGYRNQVYNLDARTATSASAIGINFTGSAQSNGANSTHIFGGRVRADSGNGLIIAKGDQIVVSGVTCEGTTATCFTVDGDSSTSTAHFLFGNRNETDGGGVGTVLTAASRGNIVVGNLYVSGLSTKISDLGENFVIEPVAAAGRIMGTSRGDIYTLSGTIYGVGIGSEVIQARGSTSDTSGRVALKGSGRVTFGDGAGSEDVIFARLATNFVQTEVGAFGWKPTDAPPTCGGTGKQGTAYFDLSLNETCFCNGTNWCKVSAPATCGSPTSCN